MRIFLKMKFTLLLVLSVLWFNSSLALNLQDALKNSYEQDETMKIIQNEFLEEVQQYPVALSDFLPHVSASIETNYTDSASGLNGYRYGRALELRQSLFEFGKSIANLKVAEYSYLSSKFNFFSKEQRAIFQQIKAYVDTIAAERKYEISKTSLKSSETMLKAANQKFKVGEATKTDIATAKSNYATAEASLSVAYANYQTALANFRKLFGHDAENLIMPEIPNNLPVNKLSFTDLAKKGNFDISALRAALASTRYSKRAAKAKLMPTAGVIARKNWDDHQFGNTVPAANSYSIGLNISIPILQAGGAVHSEIRKVTIRAKTIAIKLDSQIKEIEASCLSSWEGFVASKLRISAANKAVKAAEFAYNGMVKEERLGSKSIIDVINAQERLSKAQEEKVESEKNYVLAAFQIQALLGKLTADGLNLKVNLFDPDSKFRRVKNRVIGF